MEEGKTYFILYHNKAEKVISVLKDIYKGSEPKVIIIDNASDEEQREEIALFHRKELRFKRQYGGYLTYAKVKSLNYILKEISELSGKAPFVFYNCM